MPSKYLTIGKYRKLDIFVFLKVSFPRDMPWANVSNDNYIFSVEY